MDTSTSTDDVEVALALAFPASLRDEVRVVAGILPPTRSTLALSFSVSVQGESVTIPYRLYNDEPTAETRRALSPVQLTILQCLYTRHNDGRIRQRRLEQVIDSMQPWVMPFVIQLVGEYVLEILVTIKQRLAQLDTPGTPQHAAYGQFLAANPDFLTLTSQRVTSYWNCYYRFEYPRRRDYPGQILLLSLQNAAAAYTERSTSSMPRALRSGP